MAGAQELHAVLNVSAAPRIIHTELGNLSASTRTFTRHFIFGGSPRQADELKSNLYRHHY
jgi:hypothetical protein